MELTKAVINEIETQLSYGSFPPDSEKIEKIANEFPEKYSNEQEYVEFQQKIAEHVEFLNNSVYGLSEDIKQEFYAHQKTIQRPGESIITVLNNGHRTVTVRYKNQNGNQVHFLMIGSREYNETKHLVGAKKWITDLSAKKILEQTILLPTEQRCRLLKMLLVESNICERVEYAKTSSIIKSSLGVFYENRASGYVYQKVSPHGDLQWKYNKFCLIVGRFMRNHYIPLADINDTLTKEKDIL